MYRRVVLTLYGGCRGRLTGTRYTDHTLKCFSLGNVHCSENKPPEDQVTSKPPTEGKKSPEDQVTSKPPTEGKKSPEDRVTSKPPTERKKSPEDQVTSKPPTEGKKSPEDRVTPKPPTERKKSPEDQVTSKLPTERKKSPKDQVNAKPAGEKVDVPHKKGSSQPSQKETLRNIISSMKVEVSSPKRLLAVKRGKKEEQKWAEIRDGVQSVSKMFQMASKRTQPEENEVGPEMAAAVSAVASTFPDKKNEVESELLRHLLLHKQMGKKQGQGDQNIRKVISGMQVKHESKSSILKETQHGDGLGRMLTKQTRNRSPRLTARRLRIFPASLGSQETTVTVAESESSPTLWDLELAKEIATACEQPARNGFEEMIQWTNEGKLWTFPINNEAGLDEEQNVEFHEHIFLDRYLEDFPKQGPIRHFMELVVCGLSKNAFLTVQQKKEHIDWFLDYFKQKEEILKECDVYLN